MCGHACVFVCVCACVCVCEREREGRDKSQPLMKELLGIEVIALERRERKGESKMRREPRQSKPDFRSQRSKSSVILAKLDRVESVYLMIYLMKQQTR